MTSSRLLDNLKNLRTIPQAQAQAQPQPHTPRRDRTLTLVNPPGLSSISYRIGIYETFYQNMLDRIAEEIPELTTRNRQDLAIALMDAWACVLDVFTFYQERNANEGYLGTATERLSILQLAREIGFELTPAIAAGAPLSFIVSPSPGGFVEIPAGTEAQSAPPPGEMPQTFATSGKLEARPDWNALAPRQFRPQLFDGRSLVLSGIDLPLAPGAPVLFHDGASDRHLRTLSSVKQDAAAGTTTITWQPDVNSAQIPGLSAFETVNPLFGYDAPDWNQLPPAIQAEYCPMMPSAVNSVAYSPNGSQLIGGLTSGQLALWVIDVGSQVLAPTKLYGPYVPESAVNSVAWAPDGSCYLSGGADGLIRRWDLEGNVVQVYTGHESSVNSVAFSPQYATDGLLLSGSSDTNVILWRKEQGTPYKTFTGHTKSVNSVAFSPEFLTDRKIASGSLDTTVKVWDTDSQNPPVTLTGHTASVNGVAFSPEFSTDKQILSGSSDTTLILWVLNGTPTATTYTGQDAAITSVSFSPSYKEDLSFQSGAIDASVGIWEFGVIGHCILLNYQLLSVTGVAYSPAGTACSVSSSVDTTVVVWNLNSGLPMQNCIQKPECSNWPDYVISPNVLDLANVDPAITSGDPILVWRLGSIDFQECTVVSAKTVFCSAYSLSGQCTRIVPAPPVDIVRFHDLRTTAILSSPLALTPAEVPVAPAFPSCTEIDSGDAILDFDGGLLGLKAGQLLALSGEIYDCYFNLATGVHNSEVVEILKVEPEDGYTRVRLKGPTKFQYVRATAAVNANIALSTEGEAVPEEVLGNGDGNVPSQVFTLRRRPLTYISAPTETGGQSTLSIRVNQVLWREAPSFYDLGPKDQCFIVRTDVDGVTSVVFGDGVQGARLPTGANNVVASYRVSSESPGKVEADTITQPVNAPSNVSAVTNPERATGAAPADGIEAGRTKAPLIVSMDGRIVSLSDYDAFTRTYAGIERSRTSLLWNGRTMVVHITILGAGGQPIPSTSALYQSMIKRMDEIRDPVQPVFVQSPNDVIEYFRMAARVIIGAAYDQSVVEQAIRGVLSLSFSITSRQFAQGVQASDVIGAIQGVAGVIAVDLRALYFAGYSLPSPGLLPISPPPSLHSFLPAPAARWNQKDRVFTPDKILVLDPVDGITLSMEVNG